MQDYTWLSDAAERVIWTLLQVALAAAVVTVSDLEGIWIVPLTAFLTAVKTAVAKQVGDDTAALTVFQARKPPGA